MTTGRRTPDDRQMPRHARALQEKLLDFIELADASLEEGAQEVRRDPQLTLTDIAEARFALACMRDLIRNDLEKILMRLEANVREKVLEIDALNERLAERGEHLQVIPPRNKTKTGTDE